MLTLELKPQKRLLPHNRIKNNRAMLFSETVAGTVSSINYRSEYKDLQKLHWFLVIHISICRLKLCLDGIWTEFWAPVTAWAPTNWGVWSAGDTALPTSCKMVPNELESGAQFCFSNFVSRLFTSKILWQKFSFYFLFHWSYSFHRSSPTFLQEILVYSSFLFFTTGEYGVCFEFKSSCILEIWCIWIL